MSTGEALLVVGIVAASTYVLRTGVIVALAGRALPAQVERALRQVGPAVLAALAINLIAGGGSAPSVTVAEVAGMTAAGIVAWWRRSVMWSLVAGMAVLLVVEALM